MQGVFLVLCGVRTCMQGSMDRQACSWKASGALIERVKGEVVCVRVVKFGMS